MKHPRLKYLAPENKGWGHQKKTSTFVFDEPFRKALTSLRDEVKREHGYKQYGEGRIIESWAMTDPRFVELYNSFKEEYNDDEGRRPKPEELN